MVGPKKPMNPQHKTAPASTEIAAASESKIPARFLRMRQSYLD